MCLRSGRQVGKSYVVSRKAGDFALNNPNKTILVISAVERQAQLLFEKILAHIYEIGKQDIKRGKDRPTKHKLTLKNGSVIHCLPTGLTGYGIRGYTINLLIADEAAFIPEDVWTAVTPMLAITKGIIWLLSTPHGREGYFYDCFGDDAFTPFHVSSEDCPRKNVQFLEHERKRMTKLQYAQEYLGEFIDELKQFFPNDLITQVCCLKRTNDGKEGKNFYLGVDCARLGADESTFEIIDRTNKSKLKQVENIITTKTLTTDTTKKILNLNKIYNFRRIYIDDGGLGVGIFDQLMIEEDTRRKTEAINNARRSLDRDEKRKKKLMKEDLYNNLLRLMEREEIQLLDDDEVVLSLKSIQYEYNDDGYLKIHGNYSHITEGIIRAAWCVKDKSLNIWISSIKA